MVQDLFLYNWIKFDFYGKILVTHSKNGLTAAMDPSNTIVIWEQEKGHQGPSLTNGKLISIIVNQFKNIKQIRWVINQDKLLIRHETFCTIWEPYENISIASIDCNEDILFGREFEEGYVIAFATGSLQVFGKSYDKKTETSNGMIWNRLHSIVIYPFEYYFENGELLRLNLKMQRIDKRVRKEFRNINSINNNCKVFLESKPDQFPPLDLPESLCFHFEQAKVILIENYHNFTIFSTNKFYVIKSQINDIISFLVLDRSIDNKSINVELENTSEILINISKNAETKIFLKNDQIVSDRINNLAVNGNLDIINLPNYFFINLMPNMKTTRGDLTSGYLWIPDYETEHSFLDLLTAEAIIFQKTVHKNNVHLYIEENNEFLLEWVPGIRFPEGMLLMRHIHLHNNAPVSLYDQKNLPRSKSENFDSKTVNLSKYSTEEISNIDASFPLVIPSWTYLELDIFYQDTVFTQIISLSSLYFILNSWSQSNNASKLIYPEELPSSNSYVKFGDLKIIHDQIEFYFEGIAPIWEFSVKSGFLCIYSSDGRMYIWNLNNNDHLPIADFIINLPCTINFSPDAKYLITTSFSIGEVMMLSRPTSDKLKKILPTQFPMIEVIVFDINQNKKYKRVLRFPTHLNRLNSAIKVNCNSDIISFKFPSFIDLDRQITCIFSLSSRKFHVQTNADAKRYWNTHSINSPLNQIDKGDEFPVEPHPEIKREYALRPFYVIDLNLIRKSDQEYVVSISAIIKNAQLSTANLYSFDKSIKFEFPFHNNRVKPIYLPLNKAKLIENHNLIEIGKLREFPRYLKFSLTFGGKNRALLRRIKTFIERIIAEGSIHNENGIAYQSSKISIFKSILEVQLQALDSALIASEK